MMNANIDLGHLVECLVDTQSSMHALLKAIFCSIL